MANSFRKEEAASAKMEAQAKSVRAISSADIFQGEREVSIVHGECKYRLQITKAGKLILTK